MMKANWSFSYNCFKLATYPIGCLGPVSVTRPTSTNLLSLIRNEKRKKIHKNHELFKEALIKTPKYVFCKAYPSPQLRMLFLTPRTDWVYSLHVLYYLKIWQLKTWVNSILLYPLGALRSDESFVPWCCNQISFSLSIWPEIRYNERMGICCLGEKWVILKYRMFYFLSK